VQLGFEAMPMITSVPLEPWLRAIDEEGFVDVPAVYAAAEADALAVALEKALSSHSAATAIRSTSDVVYAARNVLELFPQADSIWRRPPLFELLEQVLGATFGLVRGLFFDKPPDQSWALPWHKDMTIAVREHGADMGPFRKPTRKADVPHVEAPRDLLDDMLTLRIHLDDVTESNGPLRVIPGSHRNGKTMAIDESQRHTVLVQKGDVLVIRPLVAHASADAKADNRHHRRILHLEFSGRPTLPAGFAWHTFLPAALP
jgi:hypothetical protein